MYDHVHRAGVSKPSKIIEDDRLITSLGLIPDDPAPTFCSDLHSHSMVPGGFDVTS